MERPSHPRRRWPHAWPYAIRLAPLAFLVAAGCKSEATKDKPPTQPPPPPPLPTAGAGDCAAGGGTNTDAVSAPIFARTVGTFCLDPAGDVRTYGDKGKLSMDLFCTTAFDGECEVYKDFGMKRAVALKYVDGSGSGGQVEIVLSSFADTAGGYAMYTKRVIADSDPYRDKAPTHLDAGGDGALGSTNAYVWKGPSVVELTFLNENQTPEDMIKSAQAILPAIAKAVGDKLPGPGDRPPGAALLDAASPGVPVAFFPKDPLGLAGVGPGAIGYFKRGDKRYAAIAIVRDDADQAKDAMKTIRSRPAAVATKGILDEAVSVVLPSGDKKTEWFFVRKDNKIVGVGDDEHVLTKDPLEKQAAVRLDKSVKQEIAVEMASQVKGAASAPKK